MYAKKFLLIFLALLLITAIGCANEGLTDANSQNTDNVEEVDVVGGGVRFDYPTQSEKEIFGDVSKEEIYDIVDDLMDKVSDDEDYENNIDSIIEEVFKDHGITDEDNLDSAKSKIRISKPE